MSTRVDSLRNTLDHLALDPRASEDRRYLVSMLRRLGYSDAEIEAHIGPIGGEPGRVIEVEYEGPVGDRTNHAASRETTFQVSGPEEGLSFRIADDDAPAGAGVDEVYATDISGVESDLGDWGDDYQQDARSDFTSVGDSEGSDDFGPEAGGAGDGFTFQESEGEVVEFRSAKRPDPAVAAGWQEDGDPAAAGWQEDGDPAAAGWQEVDEWGGTGETPSEEAPWGEETELAWDAPAAAEPDSAWSEPEAQDAGQWPEPDEAGTDAQAWPEPEPAESAWPEEATGTDSAWDEPAAASEAELSPWPETEEAPTEATADPWSDAEAGLAGTEQVQAEETAWPEDEAETAWVDADVAADAPYAHGDYTLYTRQVHLSTGREQRIYFFAKNTPQSGEPCALPDGYEVIENDKTGLPFLRRKR